MSDLKNQPTPSVPNFDFADIQWLQNNESVTGTFIATDPQGVLNRPLMNLYNEVLGVCLQGISLWNKEYVYNKYFVVVDSNNSIYVSTINNNKNNIPSKNPHVWQIVQGAAGYVKTVNQIGPDDKGDIPLLSDNIPSGKNTQIPSIEQINHWNTCPSLSDSFPSSESRLAVVVSPTQLQAGVPISSLVILDSIGKVPLAQLPTMTMIGLNSYATYQDLIDATGITIGTGGFVYKDPEDSKNGLYLYITIDTKNQWIKFNYTVGVDTINGQKGAVNLNSDQIPEGTNNKYLTSKNLERDPLISGMKSTMTTSLSSVHNTVPIWGSVTNTLKSSYPLCLLSEGTKNAYNIVQLNGEGVIDSSMISNKTTSITDEQIKRWNKASELIEKMCGNLN